MRLTILTGWPGPGKLRDHDGAESAAVTATVSLEDAVTKHENDPLNPTLPLAVRVPVFIAGNKAAPLRTLRPAEM